jgi:voltage-gated potassium channel
VVKNQSEKVGPFHILLVALSLYVLVALFIEAVISVSASTHSILLYVDNAICVIFLFDFCYRLVTANSKMRFLRWGWIDLVSSFPALPALRIGRAVRVVRVLRVLRGFRSLKTIGGTLFARRAKGSIATAIFLCTLLIVFSSITILHVETGSNANIRGPEDALWWSIVTMTTVGYGDRFPTSTEGRMIAVILMLSGVGAIAILSGAFAAWFTETEENKHKDDVPIGEQLSVLIHEVRALRSEICELRVTHDVD